MRFHEIQNVSIRTKLFILSLFVVLAPLVFVLPGLVFLMVLPIMFTSMCYILQIELYVQDDYLEYKVLKYSTNYRRIYLKDIQSVEVVKNRRVNSKHGFSYNPNSYQIGSTQLIHITLKGGNKLIIGTNRGDDFRNSLEY